MANFADQRFSRRSLIFWVVAFAAIMSVVLLGLALVMGRQTVSLAVENSGDASTPVQAKISYISPTPTGPRYSAQPIEPNATNAAQSAWVGESAIASADSSKKPSQDAADGPRTIQVTVSEDADYYYVEERVVDGEG